MIYERTTPSDIFILPLEVSECDIIEITYKQESYTIVKRYEDGTLDDGMYLVEGGVAVMLTEEETDGFNRNSMVRIQVRVKTTEGAVLASCVYKVNVGETLNKEFI